MNTTATTPDAVSERECSAVSNVDRRRYLFVAPLAVTAVFAILLAVWFSYDQRVPSTDEAGHILNSLQYRELIRHARPFRLDWWTQFLSVNQFYTPSLYMFAGALKVLLGPHRGVDIFAAILYSVAFTLGTYGIARILTRSVMVATVAAVVVNLYPQIAVLTHVYLLDFPMTAAVTVALFSLLWWREKPTVQRTAISCITLAFACMSKQIAFTFLILPGALCVVESLRLADAKERRTRLLQLTAMVAAVAACAVPWLLVNYAWIRNFSQENVANMTGLGVKLTPPGIFGGYVEGIWSSMGPVLGAASVAALLTLRKSQHKQLIPLYLSAGGGLIILSCLTMTFPLDRYVASCLVCCAIVTACGVSVLVRNRFEGPPTFFLQPLGGPPTFCRHRFGGPPTFCRHRLAAASVVGLVGVLQFISFSYTPYPFDLGPINGFARLTGIELREFRGIKIYQSVPSNGGLNWGQGWTLEQIKAVDGANPVWLNILPSQGFYNPHSFELLARERSMNARPTTSRVWTIMGDKVDFKPETALYFTWYLLKSGDQGNKLRDIESEKNYAALISFVQSSGRFRLVGEHRLPDGSFISLYRQNP